MLKTDLERELDGLDELLELRKGRDDLSFVAQVLDGLCRVLLRGFLADADAVLPRVKHAYVLILDVLRGRKRTEEYRVMRHDLSRALRAVKARVDDVETGVSEVVAAVEAGEVSPVVIRHVEASLENLLSLGKKVIAEESEQSVADTRVALSWGQEDSRTEFKASFRVDLNKGGVAKQLELSVVKSLAGLMNYRGGSLYVGVDDNGRPVGIEYDLASLKGENKEDVFLRHFSGVVMEHLGRENYQFLETAFVPIGGVRLFVVEVRPSTWPVFVRRGRDELFFVRAGASTMSLNAREAIAYYVSRWPSNPLGVAPEAG